VAEIDPLLKTRQVAEAFRVSASTVKRWVDSGLIPSTRTVGGHRLVSRSDALKFAREQDLHCADWELLGCARSAGPSVLQEGTVVELSDLLVRGKAREARKLIHLAFTAPCGALGLGDNLIRPVMERIGDQWRDRTIDIFQEHRASRIVESAVVELIQQMVVSPRDPEAPLAVVAASENDPYILPCLLAELTLRELGWEVMNLGANLPLSSLARAVRENRPRLVGLSVSHLDDPARFVEEYAVFHDDVADQGAAVMLGGRGLTDALRAQVVSCGYGDRLAHLAQFAKQLRPRPPFSGLGHQSDAP
jgi:excisionase family DNA binding protein